MPNTGSAAPALSDAALRETLDLMGQVVANMAGKLDRHALILAQMQTTAQESRDAALKAQAQTDPRLYGRHIGNQLDKAMDASLDRLEALQSGFATDRQETRKVLSELEQQEETMLIRLRDDLETARRWKKRIPFIAIAGLVLVLGLSVVLPRVLAGNSATCAVLGGEWMVATSEQPGCVFVAE